MKKIIINSENRRFNISSTAIGYLEENKAEKIEFEIPKEYQNYGKKACFSANGTTFAKLFDNITSNILTITRDISQYSELDLSIEFFKAENEDEIIARTSILHIVIENAIVCEDVKPDDKKVVILNELIEKVTSLQQETTKNEEIREENEQNRIKNEEERILYYENIKEKVENGDFNGKDALINGVNTLEIVEGDNIHLEQQANVLTISNTYSYDDSEIKGNIEKINRDLNNYSLITETGSKVVLNINPSTYIMTLELKDKENNTISSGQVDLPLETMVVGATYNSETKEIELTLQNGTKVSFSVADLTSGLVNENDLTTKLNDYALKTSIPTKTSQLNNDSGFIDKSVDNLDNYYNKDEVDVKIQNIKVSEEQTTFMKKVESKNFIIPITKEEDGLNFVYDNENGNYKITGTKIVGDTLRITIADFILSEDGDYTFSFIDNNGQGKPSMYICNDENIIGTWARAQQKITVNLQKNINYTLEMFVSNGSENNFDLKLQGEYGSTSTSIENAILFKLNNNILNNGKYNLTGKKISILGVSVDTYKDYIPVGNATYYSSSNLPDVNMTWWKKLLNITGMELVINNSWSGACASTKKSLESSGVYRCTNLGDNPDYIIIGAFALNDWINSDLTYYDKDTMNIPDISVDLSQEESYNQYITTIESYGGAMATIFYRLMQKYPSAKILVMDSYNYYRQGIYPFTPSVSTPKINLCNEILYDVARQFCVEVINVSQCGITAFNSRQFCVEGLESTAAIHPNDTGHTMLFNKVLEKFIIFKN